MNKFSTACCALLLSLAPVATAILTTVAAPVSPSSSKSVLVAGNYNSYRANWEKAIRNGVIVRPSKVANLDTSEGMFWAAVRDGDNYNATRRLGQYMVIYSERYGVNAALQEEARLDNMMRQQTGSSIRGHFPLFNSIFPSFQNAGDYAADE